MTMSMSDGDLHVNNKHPFPRRGPSGVDSVSDSILSLEGVRTGVDSVSDSILSPEGVPSRVDSVLNGDFLG